MVGHWAHIISWVIGNRAAITMGAGMVLAIVIDRASGVAYIDLPVNAPIEHLMCAMREAANHGVVFDLDDPQLQERHKYGTRVHGMFLEDIVPVETRGIGELVLVAA